MNGDRLGANEGVALERVTPLQIFKCLAVFALGGVSFIKIDLVGSISGTELMLIGLVPFVFISVLAELRNKFTRQICMLLILYLASQIASDIFRGSDPSDYVRGWTRIVFTMISFVFFRFFFKGAKKAVPLAYLLGTCLSPVLGYLVYGEQAALYKFYFGLPIAICSFLICGFFPPGLSNVGLTIPLVAGVLAFFQDFRSLAGASVIAAVVFALAPKMRQIRHWSNLKLALALICLGLLPLAIVKGYAFAAVRGAFGEDVRDKYFSQTHAESSALSILLAGRTEVLFMGPKIMESPLLGYGSWPKDWAYVQSRASEIGLDNLTGILGSAAFVDLGLIPMHSHIFGAWLEAGILGFLFWAYCFWLTLRTLLTGAVGVDPGLRPVFVFTLVLFLWDLLFSPYGGDNRVKDGFIIAWILVAAVPNEKQDPHPASRIRHLVAQFRRGKATPAART